MTRYNDDSRSEEAKDWILVLKGLMTGAFKSNECQVLNEVRMNENADSLGDSSCVNKPVHSWSRVVLQNVDRRVEGHGIPGVVEFSR